MQPDLKYGLTSGESIRQFLDFWLQFEDEFKSAFDDIISMKAKIYSDPKFGFSWCHLYEMPFKEHLALAYLPVLEDENILEIHKGIVGSADQIAVIPDAVKKIDLYISSWDEPTQEDQKLLPKIVAFMAIQRSVYLSFQCVMYFGCFLNDLIDRARNGDDEALFNAIRIDPTIIGCQTTTLRMSKAIFTQDEIFFRGIKSAFDGKLGKRAQANFRKMRLVLEILYESEANTLTDHQLEYLFVKTLKLYSWNEKEGGNAKALRKLVETYMRKPSTT